MSGAEEEHRLGPVLLGLSGATLLLFDAFAVLAIIVASIRSPHGETVHPWLWFGVLPLLGLLLLASAFRLHARNRRHGVSAP